MAGCAIRCKAVPSRRFAISCIGTQLPSVEDFQLAVEQAFAAWTTVDPVTGLHTDITFVADFATPVVGSERLQRASTPTAPKSTCSPWTAVLLDVQARTGFQAIERVSYAHHRATNYHRFRAISGIDITFNNNAGRDHLESRHLSSPADARDRPRAWD